MTQFRLVIGVEENSRVRVEAEVDPQAIFTTANTVERATIRAIVLPLGKKCGKCGKDNHSKAVCKSTDKRDSSKHRPKVKGEKDIS